MCEEGNGGEGKGEEYTCEEGNGGEEYICEGWDGGEEKAEKEVEKGAAKAVAPEVVKEEYG